MALLLLRTFIVYFLIILAMRLMGKKQLGELQPSELVSTILISNLASISIESPEMPILSSLVPVFVIVSLEILLSALCMKSRRAEQILSGSPRIIVQNGKLDQAQMRDLRFTADDLLEALRSKDIFELSDVELAVVETNGSVSVKKKFAAETPTNGDLKLPASTSEPPSLPVVVNGHIIHDHLRRCGVDEHWLAACCKRMGCPVTEIYLLLCNKKKKLTLIRKERA